MASQLSSEQAERAGVDSLAEVLYGPEAGVRYSPEEFWGKEVWSEGYAAVPRRFLVRAKELGLDPTDQALLVHLLSFKMTKAAPWPSVRKLGERVGLSESAVRRRLRKLHKRKLILREARTGRSNEYNLQPLAAALRELAPVVPRGSREGARGRGERNGQQRRQALGASDRLTRTTDIDEGEEEQQNNIIASLTREGVRGSVALRLLDRYGEAACRRQLEWLPYREARERAAVLVESIKKGWGPPSQWTGREGPHVPRL